jgi:ketosteroid isomerase-like protein
VVLAVETMKWILRALLVAALAGMAWWLWQRVFVTDETRIKRQIAAMTSAVEKGNLLRLDGAIAGDYTDDFGLDKSSLLTAVRSFRAQYDALFIHLSDLTVTVEPDHQKAQAVFIAKVLARLKGGTAETEVRAERFRLFFRKTDDGWKLVHTESPELKFD